MLEEEEHALGGAQSRHERVVGLVVLDAIRAALELATEHPASSHAGQRKHVVDDVSRGHVLENSARPPLHEQREARDEPQRLQRGAERVDADDRGARHDAVHGAGRGAAEMIRSETRCWIALRPSGATPAATFSPTSNA